MNRSTDGRFWYKYFSPDSEFRAKFKRICGSYNHSGSRFYPVFGPGFGFLLLGSSDRGSLRCLENLTFSLLCAGWRDGFVMAVMKVAFYPRGTSHLSDDTGVYADGPVSERQFQQPVGLCVEFDSVVYF